MTELFEMLTPEAQEDLIRDHIIELVTIIVQYPPEKNNNGSRTVTRGMCRGLS